MATKIAKDTRTQSNNERKRFAARHKEAVTPKISEAANHKEQLKFPKSFKKAVGIKEKDNF